MSTSGSALRATIGGYGHNVYDNNYDDNYDGNYDDNGDDYGYGHRGGYGYPEYRRHYRISCGRAQDIVANAGFHRVRPVDCSLPGYRYTARKNGHKFMVRVNGHGNITGVSTDLLRPIKAVWERARQAALSAAELP